MENATPLSHRLSVFTISGSRLFERAAYYGLRMLLITYIISDAFGSGTFSLEGAVKIYGIFTGAIIFTQFIGALIGDFLTGNKVSMVIGIFLQALGAFALSIPSPLFLYAGLGLIILGGGLYSPNTLALFGKQYLDRKQMADSGFMLFYVAINIGAFIGIMLISSAQENFGFSLGFIISGALFVIAGVLAILAKDEKGIVDQPLSISITSRTINVILAFATTAVFWWIYELSGSKSRELQQGIATIGEDPITFMWWQSFNSIATMLIGIALIFLWSRLNISQYIKIGVGFLIASVVILAYYLFPPVQTTSHIILFGGLMFLMSIAELFIAPTIYASIARHVNPKYMATVMSITFMPLLVFQAITGIFGAAIYQNPNIVLLICFCISAIIGVSMLALQFLLKDE